MTEDKPPPQKFGHQCVACGQRIPVFKPRFPVKARPKVLQSDGVTYSHESLRLVGFRHPGCSLRIA